MFEIRDEGVFSHDYDITLSRDLVAKIIAGDIGRVRVARKYEGKLTPNQAMRLISMLRDPEIFTLPDRRIPDPPKPVITGPRPEDARPDPDKLLSRAVEDYAARRKRKTSNKEASIDFSGDKPVGIAWIADTHIGNKGTDVERAFREIRVVRDTPGMFSFFCGDLIDNFIIGVLSQVNLTQRATIEDQWALGQHYLRQAPDSWLGYVSGNHEQWSLRVAGYDTNREIVPAHCLYDTDELDFTVRLAGHEWKCIVRHKWPGNSIYNPLHPQTRGSKFARPGRDVYVGAHTHPGGLAADHPAGDGRIIHLVQCGTYKDDDSYARRGGFPITGKTTAVVSVFYPNGNVESFANLDAAADMLNNVYGTPKPGVDIGGKAA